MSLQKAAFENKAPQKKDDVKEDNKEDVKEKGKGKEDVSSVEVRELGKASI
jgi:hypothetical protein